MAFLFGRKKTPPQHQHFHRYHSEWLSALSTTLLPLLRHAMSANSPPNLLPSATESLLQHLTSYYDSLDSAAATSSSSPHLLFPSFCSSLEKPFLWLGHLHPYLFTNLLRSFLEESDEDELPNFGESSNLFEKTWNVVMAWKNPSNGLMGRIDQIECGLRLMVPALASRAREAQVRFVERVGAEWERSEGRRERVRERVGEEMVAEMEEMTCIFIDANRLRRSVLADIMGVLDVYQGALFLEGLAQFLVGFGNSEFIAEIEKSKVAIN